MKKNSVIIAIVYALGFSAWAQQDEQQATTDQDAQAQIETDLNDETTTTVDQEDFIPSEEISEDQPVAFPVDI